MSELSTALDTLSMPASLVALLVIGLASLQVERWWTRARRQRGVRPGPVAYALDGLSVLSVLLCAAGVLALVYSAVVGLLALAAGEPWALAGLVAAGISVVVAIVLLRRRAVRAAAMSTTPQPSLPASSTEDQPADALVPAISGLGSRKAPPASGPESAPAMATPGSSSALSQAAGVASAGLAQRVPLDSPAAPGGVDDQPLPSLAMLQQRRTHAASPQPQSFLGLAEPGSPVRPAAKPQKRRASLVPSLLLLVVVGALAGGGLLYHEEIAGWLAGVTAPAAGAAPAALTVAAGQSASDAQATSAPAAQIETRRVRSDSLNVRSGPGTDQQVVLVLARGATVTLLNETRDVQGTTWIKVRVGEQEGWVSQKLLE